MAKRRFLPVQPPNTPTAEDLARWELYAGSDDLTSPSLIDWLSGGKAKDKPAGKPKGKPKAAPVTQAEQAPNAKSWKLIVKIQPPLGEPALAFQVTDEDPTSFATYFKQAIESALARNYLTGQLGQLTPLTSQDFAIDWQGEDPTAESIRQVRQLQRDRDNAQADLKAQRDRVLKLEQEQRDLRRQLDDVKMLLSMKILDCEDLRHERDRTTGELATVRTKLAEYEGAVDQRSQHPSEHRIAALEA